jgi:hypothetical protein
VAYIVDTVLTLNITVERPLLAKAPPVTRGELTDVIVESPGARNVNIELGLAYISDETKLVLLVTSEGVTPILLILVSTDAELTKTSDDVRGCLTGTSSSVIFTLTKGFDI